MLIKAFFAGVHEQQSWKSPLKVEQFVVFRFWASVALLIVMAWIPRLRDLSGRIFVWKVIFKDLSWEANASVPRFFFFF